MQLAPTRRQPIPGATRSGKGGPTAMAAVASGMPSARRRSARLPPISSAFMMYTGTCGSGSRTAMHPTTQQHTMTVQHGCPRTALNVSSAAAPGSMYLGSSERPFAAVTPPTSGTTISVSVSAERFPRPPRSRPRQERGKLHSPCVSQSEPEAFQCLVGGIPLFPAAGQMSEYF